MNETITAKVKEYTMNLSLYEQRVSATNSTRRG